MGIKQLAIYFGSIFLLFSYESSLGPHSWGISGRDDSPEAAPQLSSYRFFKKLKFRKVLRFAILLVLVM